MFRSFRSALVIIILLSATLPAILFSSLLVDKIYNITSAAALKELNLQVRSLSDSLSHEVDLITFRLLTLGANRDIALATTKSALGVRHFLSYRAMDYIREFISDNSLVSSIYLIGLDSQVVDAAPASVAEIEPTSVIKDLEALFARNLNDAKSRYVFVEFRDSDLISKTFDFIDNEKKTPVGRPIKSDYGIAVIVPLILDVTNEVKGALIAIIPFENLASYTFSKVKSPTSLTFFKDEGSFLAQTQGERPNSEEKNILSEAQVQIKNSEFGKDIRYRIRISEPYAVRFAEVNETLTKLVTWIIGAVVLLSMFAYVIARWLESPFKTLSEIVSSYAAGNYGVSPHQVRFLEFQKFVTLLGEMADKIVTQLTELQISREKLEEYSRTLEWKVEGRTRELTEALEQQTATSEILRVISRSPTDVQPVFEAIVRSAARLCDAGFSAVARFDDGLLHLVALNNMSSEETDAFHSLFPRSPRRNVVMGRAFVDGRPVHVEDVLGEPDYDARTIEVLQRVARYRTVLGIPMLREGMPIGVIGCGRREVKPFTATQIELVKTFADQAVIAIENVRLFTDLQTRTQELARLVEELQALGEVSQVVSSTLDLQTVLSVIVDRAVQLSGASGGAIYEYDEAAQVFELRTTHGAEAEFVQALQAAPIPLGQGAVGHAAVTRAPVQVPDILDEQAPVLTRARRILAQAGSRSLLAVPLLLERRILGGLVVWRQAQGSFPTEMVHLLQTFATQSTLAIQNARLFREIEDKGQQLELASQHKSQFLANMSHELRTPLNAIIGYSEMLQEEAADLGYADFTPDLQKIDAAGKHLLALINDILDLSKIEAGRMDLYLEPFDLATMLQDVEATVQPLVEKNANTLVVQCADHLGSMRADLTKVRQALFNLLSNACKFTKQGTVALAVRRQAEEGAAWITFCVSDTGIGMTPEQMGRLFQVFAQADASTTRQYGGTGLGLAITKKFCQMMGGDITVESVAGQGSIFTIRLPAEVSDPKAQSAPPDTSTSEVLPDGKSAVLVIDDDPTVCDLLQRFLSKEGFRVASATGGEEGLRLAKALRPAAITLDVMMPGLDGWAVLVALKADPDLADIPVIMVTIVDDKNLGYALGAADYLTKPVDLDRLVAVLQKYRCEDSSRLILVVEDEAATRDMLRRTLDKEGWTVSEAENGRVGLERVGENRPALILLDLMMPEMDGFAFVTALRQHQEWRTIPVIVVTAKDLTPEERQRLNGHVEQILQKAAYSRDDLLREVRDLVAQGVRQTSVISSP